MNLLKLTISRVDQPLFDGEVIQVAVPGVAGDMVILADHEPLISPLRAGILVVTTSENEQQSFEIETGTLEVSNNTATILV